MIKVLRASLSLTASIALVSSSQIVKASPHITGPCSARLESLGYLRVKLDAAQAHSSLYKARRGHDDVKLIVNNQSCVIQKFWMDD